MEAPQTPTNPESHTVTPSKPTQKPIWSTQSPATPLYKSGLAPLPKKLNMLYNSMAPMQPSEQAQKKGKLKISKAISLNVDQSRGLDDSRADELIEEEKIRIKLAKNEEILKKQTVDCDGGQIRPSADRIYNKEPTKSRTLKEVLKEQKMRAAMSLFQSILSSKSQQKPVNAAEV